MLKFRQSVDDEGAEFLVKDLEFEANISLDMLKRNFAASMARNGNWLKDSDAHDGTAIIVAGGPSLASELQFLRACQARGDVVFALNNVPAYLFEHGITPDCHVLLDGIEAVKDYVHPEIPMVRYYSSQCDPTVFERAPAAIMWTPHIIGLEKLFPDLQPPYVGGGTTVGTRAIGLAYLLGYRKFRLIGLDCSYKSGREHAYTQLPDLNEVLTVRCGAKEFACPPQLMAQAEEFQVLVPELLAKGCEISVYGDGLLRALADEMAQSLMAA